MNRLVAFALGIVVTLVLVGATGGVVMAVRSHQASSAAASKPNTPLGNGPVGPPLPGQLTIADLPLEGGRGGDPGDDYPWRSLPQDSRLDPWGEYVRECTSFVAWALHSRNGFSMPFHANAIDWGADARRYGFVVNSTPTLGAVAWGQKPPYGHVAWVSQVSSGTVTIEEYNEYGTGTYDTRRVNVSAYAYIHFKDLPAPLQQPVAQVPPTTPAPVPVQKAGSGAAVQPAGGGSALQPATGGGALGAPPGGTTQVQPGGSVSQAPPSGGQGGGTPSPTLPPPTPTPPARPVFTVMNTSEQLPDGVWFRNSPHIADTARITGLGVYANEQVRLQCYAFGDAVGPYHDTLWYYVTNVTRPTVGGLADAGYLNAHYVNDGKAAGQVDSGVPAC